MLKVLVGQTVGVLRTDLQQLTNKLILVQIPVT